MSTFKLITEFNILSKRSYNDISQYIIFPSLFGFEQDTFISRNLTLPVLFNTMPRILEMLDRAHNNEIFIEAGM